MQKNKSNSVYFGADKAEDLVSYLQKKGQNWYDSAFQNKYIDKLKKSWMSYHGHYYENSHQVSYGGEVGELVNLPVNHYKNIAGNMITMITATRPAFNAKSINTDYESQVQTQLANGLLEYYLREKRLEKHLKTAVEYAVVMGAGYIKMEWDASEGEIYDYIDVDESSIAGTDSDGDPVDSAGKKINPFPIYEGDVKFSNLSPFDVVFDSTKEDSMQHDWVLIRTFKNKFDLIAKYPELEDKILSIPTKSDRTRYRVALNALDETVDVPVYEFFHKRSPALPNGRYVLYLADDCILMDTAMPYRRLPVYRISAGEMLGTPYAYTPMFDLLPIQDAVNSLFSTVLTNQSAFGVQNILNPRGNDIRVNQVEGGLNFIEYNTVVAGGGNGKPEALNLTNTPAEIFNFMQMLIQQMEIISGVNSVVRGAPEKNLRSGSSLAMVQSQALQFMSGLQQSYIMTIEDVGTGLVELLQDFATVPRIAQISGIANKPKMEEFSGRDLEGITRVIVDVGNALSQCLAKDTPVLMYDGSIKMVQDIKIGDQVMGPDSKPRTVKNANSGIEEMFEIAPKEKLRDIAFTCNKSHILTLRYCSDDTRYNAKKGDIVDLSVAEYLKLSKRHKRLLQGMTTSIDFKEQEVLIPPYILGSWIGDGTSASSSITSMDSEIVKEWSDYASKLGMNLRKTEQPNNRSSVYHITSGKQNGRNDRNPMTNMLRAMNLINNKHIPSQYLINSKQIRLELLAGIIDTDGTLVDETFVISQKSEVIIDQIKFLAASLGFRTSKKLQKREFNGKPADIFKVTIGGNTHIIPTRLERKQAKNTVKSKNWNNYGIEVTSVGEGTYYGFTLEEEPHFVLANFVITHNTTAGRIQMADGMMQMGLIKTPEDYYSVINTGRLDVLTENQNDENLLVKAENERLVSGTSPVIASQIDQHAYHIKKHRSILADPDLRLDSALVQRAIEHIQSHIEMLRTTDPALLAILGEQSLGPMPGTPPAMMLPPNMAQPDQSVSQPQMMPEAQSAAPMNLAGFPNEPVQLPESPMPDQGQPIGRPLGG